MARTRYGNGFHCQAVDLYGFAPGAMGAVIATDLEVSRGAVGGRYCTGTTSAPIAASVDRRPAAGGLPGAALHSKWARGRP